MATEAGNELLQRGICTHVLGGYPGEWVTAERHLEVVARIAEIESEVSLYRAALEKIATFREDRPAPTPEAEIAQDALKGEQAK